MASVARCAQDTDVCVVEGVMGLYDGRDGRSEHGSTAQLAKWLSAPVVLVLDCWSLARSAAALVAGFAAFDPGVQVAAVVFNKTGGEAHTAWLRDALDAAHAQPLVLGGIPRDAGVAVAAGAGRPEGGGGSHVRAWPWACPHAGGASPEYLHCLAALIDTHLDVDALLKLAAPMPPALLRLGQGPTLAAVLALPSAGAFATPNGAASPGSALRTPSGALATSPVDSPSTGPGVRARIAALAAAQSPGSHGTPSGPLSPAGSRPVTPTAEVASGVLGARASPAGGNSGPITPPSFGRVRIGVARDAAFPHVYSTNLALLAEAGAELVFFSPAGGDPLPPRLCGLYLPAGSPDHFAPQLAANSRLRSGVAAFAAGGGVILAECGGMQFLCSSLHHPASKTDRGWPMCGVLPVDARLAPRGGTRVGYATVTVLGDDSSRGGTPLVFSSPDGSPDRGDGDGDDAAVLPRDTSLRGQLYQAWEFASPQSADAGDFDQGIASALPPPHPDTILLSAGWRPAFQMALQHQGDVSGHPTPQGWARGAVVASFVQLHFGSSPGCAASFVARCRAVPPGASAAAAAAAASAVPFDIASVMAPGAGAASHSLIPPGTPLREMRSSSHMGLLGHMAGMSPFGGGGGGAATLRRVPSNSALYAGGAGGATPRGGDGGQQGGGALTRAGSNLGVSSSFAFGPLISADHSAGSGLFRMGRNQRSASSSDVTAGGFGGADEAVAGGHHQWALHPSHASNNNMAALAAAAAAASAAGIPGGGGSGSGSNNNSRSAGVMGPHGGGARTAVHAMLSRDMTAPVFAISDGEVVLPPATRPGLNRLLGDDGGTVVSLLPAATDVLAALGDAVLPRLQGISDLCEAPRLAAVHGTVPLPPRVVSRSRVDVSHLSSAEVETALRSLAERGEPAFVLDTAWLAAAAPSVVITQDLCGIGTPDTAGSVVSRSLADARLLGPGSPTAVLVVRPRTLADALDAVVAIGSAVGAEAVALALQETLQTRLRHVAAAVAGADRPRVLSLEGLKPLLTGGHWLPDMKALAGGCDDLHEPGCPAERLRWEQVLSYNPDVLLVLPCNPSLDVTLTEVALLAQQPGFWALKAVTSNQLFLLDHTRFSRPGPHLVDGVEVLARVLHPGLWPHQLPPGVALRLAVPRGQRCRPHQLRQFFEEYR